MLMNNQIILWNDEVYRVLSIYKEQVALYPMNSSDSGINIKVLKTAELISAEKNDEIVSQSDIYYDNRAKAVPAFYERHVENNYSLIRTIVEDQSLIFNVRNLKNRIRELCINENNRSKERQIKRLLNIWWRKGQAKGVLIPQFGKKTGRHSCKTKPGRKSKISTNGGTIITEEIRERFDYFCRKNVLKVNGDSLKTAYRLFLNEFLNKYPEVEEKDAPSYHQFTYFYYSEYNIRQRNEARNTKIHFDKDMRALKGSSQDIVIGAGSIYTIDSTPADITLVAEDDHSKIVGRPTLYIVRDVFTTMIVGLTVSFDPAMYKTAADALYIAMISKVEYCRKFGLDITEDMWPAKGIPACVVADNGELAGSRIDVFSSAYHVKITTTVPYRGDQKGIVEETFNALQKSVSSILPGIPDKPGSKKSGYKEKRHEAALTLKDYTKLMLLAAMDVNNHICRTVPKSLPAELAPTPRNLWQWSREQNYTQLREVEDQEKLRLMLLPRFKPTISRDGLNVNKIRYFCEEGANKGYFDRGIREKRPQNMQIAIDPADISNAWLFPEPQTQPLMSWNCTLASTSRHLEGMTLYEAGLYIGTAAEAKAKAERMADVFGGKIRLEQEKLVRDALKAKPKTSLSVNKQLKQVAQNRKEERIKQESQNPRLNSAHSNKLKKTNGSEKKKQIKLSNDFRYPQSFEDIPD